MIEVNFLQYFSEWVIAVWFQVMPWWCPLYIRPICLVLWVMVFNATFNNFSVILAISFIGVLGENHQPAASHWQTLSHNFVWNTPCHGHDSNSLSIVYLSNTFKKSKTTVKFNERSRNGCHFQLISRVSSFTSIKFKLYYYRLIPFISINHCITQQM